MNIAVDCRMSGKSGIGAFLDGILPYFITSGHSLLLLVPDADNLQEPLRQIVKDAPDIRLLSCPVKIFSFQELLFFPHALTAQINACDIFFTPYCNIPSGITVPVYSTIHDIVFLDMPELAGKAGTFIRRIFYRHAVRRSKELFTVSRFSKSRIQEKLNCRKQIHVVYSALPSHLGEPLEPLPKKTDTIIFIGNIKKHKGLSVLLKSFRHFRIESAAKGEPLPQLVIIGSMEHFRTKDESLDNMLLNAQQDGIHFTGYIPDEKLKLLLSQAKVLVQPSFYEGFGLPPLQALCCGTQAILSDIPVFKEIYGGFPVTFFKAGDSDDLAVKLRTVWESKDPVPPVPHTYSFERTASLILAVLTKTS